MYDVSPGMYLEKTSKKEVTINRDLQAVVRGLKNRQGESPCQNAEVGVVTINPGDEVFGSALYVYRPVLEKVNNSLVPYYESFGVDMFNLDGIVTVTNPSTGEVNRIAPPIAAINEDGKIQIIDGHDRMFLANYYGLPIKVAVISGVEMKYLTDGMASSFSDIKVFDRFPKPHEKKIKRPGVDVSMLVDLSEFGSGGKRISKLSRDAAYFPEDPTRFSSGNLVRQTTRLLRHMHVNPMFPSAINSEGRNRSRVETVSSVVQLSDELYMPTISISWVDGAPGKLTTFKPIAEALHVSNTAESSLVIIKNTSEVVDNTASTAAGSLSIPVEIRQEINRRLSELDLVGISDADHPDLDTESPNVTSFEIVEDNANYFHVLRLNYGEGDKARSSAFVINRQRESLGAVRESLIFVTRSKSGEIIFVDHYRELFGMHFLELPRMFANSDPLTRYRRETGINISQDDMDEAAFLLYPEARQFQIATSTIVSLSLSDDGPPMSSQVMHDEEVEISHTRPITDAQIHDIISDGEMTCEITNSAITIDQLSRGILKINPSANRDMRVVLERYYNALESKYYFRPIPAPTGSGSRVGKNSFPNTGNSLIYRHSEVAVNHTNLPSGHDYREVSVQDIPEMIAGGQLDSSAIAHISTVFRNQGIFVVRK